MSISLLLVPLAVAAVSAWETSREPTPDGGAQVCQVSTRMKDAGLLRQALEQAGARVDADPAGAGDGALIARWSEVEARFARGADGIWSAHFSGPIDRAGAVDLVRAVDRWYGRGVQAAVVDTLKQRVAAAGMRLESETRTDDESVTLVLAVERGAHERG